MKTIEEVMAQDTEVLLAKVRINGTRSSGGSCYISFSGEMWNWFQWHPAIRRWSTWTGEGWRFSTKEEETLAEILVFPDAPRE